MAIQLGNWETKNCTLAGCLGYALCPYLGWFSFLCIIKSSMSTILWFDDSHPVEKALPLFSAAQQH